MPGRALVDEKIKARTLFVEDGIVSFTDLAKHVGASRQAISAWAEKENWVGQRTSQITRPDNIAARMLKVLERYLVQVEAMQADGVDLSPIVMKQLRDMTKSVRSIKDDFDERGSVITMWRKLIAYLTTLPAERELLKQLQRVAPGFFSYIEQ